MLIKKYWVVLIAVGILWAGVTISYLSSVRQNQGNLIYTLDDAYIHMAVAKNFAQHGTWGVTRHAFTSSSSSLLWTLLLSFVYFLFGVNEVSPFILNVVCATLVCFTVYFLLRENKLNPFVILIVLLSIIFFTPLIPLIFCGMEHPLHILLSILFVYYSAKTLSEPESTVMKSPLPLIIGPLMVMARFEGLFLIFVVSCLFILRRRPLYAFLLGVVGVIPVAIYGLVSISKGWYFLPNSVLLKGSVPKISSISGIIRFLTFFDGFLQLKWNTHLLTLILVSLIIFNLQYIKKKNIWESSLLMIIIFVSTSILHAQFAKTGWFFRYEAYLVAIGIFVLGISLHEYLGGEFRFELTKSSIPQHVSLIFVVILCVFPHILRTKESLCKIDSATKNIYEQQYQMGLFLRKFYQGETIVVNDIGATTFLADIECIDIMGLGTMDVAEAIRDKGLSSQNLYEMAKSKNAKIAIVYKEKLDKVGGVPAGWKMIGQWEIPDNYICAFKDVSFFAINPSEKDILLANLRKFFSRLPKDVKQKGIYVNTVLG